MRSTLTQFSMAVVLGTALTLVFSQTPIFAQTRVKTETIQIPPVDEDPPGFGNSGTKTGDETGTGADQETGTDAESAADSEPSAGMDAPTRSDVLYDLSVLPRSVARLREQMIDAAKTGDIERMRPILEANEMPPIVSFGGESDPIDFWRSSSGDPDGREVLAIMIEILESGFAHLDQGTTQEMFVWPYFYALPLDGLTPRQEVELYKLITPQDRELMEEFGAYNFFRLGIGPDGTWHFFVAGD